jgi:hypothetical protein
MRDGNKKKEMRDSNKRDKWDKEINKNMKWLRLTERIIASKWETKINEINAW